MSDKAKDEPKRPVIAVPAESGVFRHQAEGAETACLTDRPEPTCACGMYDLAWESAAPARRSQYGR